ncbi:MAG: NADH:ubiquinone reductase (Na(+)-transporting) subunit B [Reichenbachiella sp.]|uniref:NADH:ubiquinone reductase (Na(+)-transporting) subunit B n=2 Tax=Reichenbachiella sp. TaxID=2184521 RepID=UPI0032673DCA
MKFIEDIFAKVRPNFEKGGKWEKFFYIYEAHETLFLAPNSTTGAKGAQIKDAIDMKRMMMTVIIAMLPCLLFGIWNAGHQHYLAVGEVADLASEILLGATLVVPILIVSYSVGLGIEFTFATIRKHEVNEGFLVTGMLIPLVMPPTIPLWQVGLATAFAVIIGKEAFGGTGMNILNVALTARAFLYFAYPSQISGDVWSYLGGQEAVAGFSGATPLAIGAAAVEGNQSMLSMLGETWSTGLYSFNNLFMGIIPGSIGETSTLMCLIGAAILVLTGVGSWKIIFSVFAGAFVMGTVCNMLGVNEYMLLPAHYHLVIGGLAFGAVFMASDPVTATQTETGKWIYGFLIGMLTVIIRVFNPAYPEGIMLAILLMNVFAPLIDYYVVAANKKRRLKRATI